MYSTALAGLGHRLHVFKDDIALVDISAIDDLVGDRASAPHAHARFGGGGGRLRDLTGGWSSLGRLILRKARATNGAKRENTQNGHSSTRESSKHKSSGVGDEAIDLLPNAARSRRWV
jgi:hypothetical protein